MIFGEAQSLPDILKRIGELAADTDKENGLSLRLGQRRL